MSGLVLDVDLDKICQNALTLVDRLAAQGVSVTAVTKALLGEPRLAQALAAAGAEGLGDSRIANIEGMRHAHVTLPMVLIRSPMLSEVDRIVRSNTISLNSELDVLTALATSARVCGRVHDVMVMVELGDLREGVMPADVEATVRHILRRPSLRLRGIGANLACRNGVEPTDDNMGELTRLVESVESTFGIEVETVSGGNSANLGWLESTTAIGRINNVRLGESILLGRNPLDRQPISGLHTDAIALSCEVIESIRKPVEPWGRAGQNAFGEVRDNGDQHSDDQQAWQTIVAVGRQDTEPDDLASASGMSVLGASSDHLVLATPTRLAPGTTVRFEPGYNALLRSATSPFVEKRFRRVDEVRRTVSVSSRRRSVPAAHGPGSSRGAKLTLVPRSPAAG